MEDERIIGLYFERSEEAIAETARKYGRFCHSISYHILQNHEDAEECVNDAFMGAWKAIPPAHPACLQAFLGKITRNLSINRLKERKARKRGGGQVDLVLSELEECIPAPDNVEQMMVGKSVAESISRYLYSLTEEKRNVFIRRYWYLYSIGEIAGQYGMSENKVALMLLRMRKGLRNHLEKEGIML